MPDALASLLNMYATPNVNVAEAAIVNPLAIIPNGKIGGITFATNPAILPNPTAPVAIPENNPATPTVTAFAISNCSSLMLSTSIFDSAVPPGIPSCTVFLQPLT